MNNLIELVALNKALQDQKFLLSLDSQLFPLYKEEYEFIKKFFSQYNKCPDRSTILSNFENFEFIQVSEPKDYILGQLQENKMYHFLAHTLQEVSEMVVNGSSLEAYSELMRKLQNVDTVVKTDAFDIIKEAEQRLLEYREKCKKKGMVGIATGVQELDELTNGWQSEDLVVVAGRTNEGKSWVLLYFLLMAWREGKKVLLYSGEMNETSVGYRFDTLNEHFNFGGLFFGNENLGEGKGAMDYEAYIDDLTKSEMPPFVVVTPRKLGGRLTVTQLHNLIEIYQPDIIGIDQISLMKDERSKGADQLRIQYQHIAEDLFLTTEKYQKPIIALSQANRASRKDTDGSPELEHLSESDGISHNATRVLTIKQVKEENKMIVSIKKNRYGYNNRDVELNWQVNEGKIHAFTNPNPTSTLTPNEKSLNDTLPMGADIF